MNERDFQRQVTDLAEVLGWSWAHFRPAQTNRGWRTPVQGSLGRGFPDLVLVRERVIYAELKGERGRLSEHQAQVLDELRAAGAEVYVWTPEDLDDVVLALNQRGRPEAA